jgi:thymidylate synthase ThyX
VDGDFQPTARVIADSLAAYTRIRLTTIEVTCHRFVLAELNTHRAFSRNSASSRAIPVARTMQRVAEDPALPLSWPAEQKGMQGGEELADWRMHKARDIWLSAMDDAVSRAEQLVTLGVHKSVINRLLEPFMATTVIVSATDWDGFWEQRCSPLAQPEIRAAAVAMKAAYDASEPRLVPQGRYHLPYITEDDIRYTSWGALPRISAARCARVSYLTHDGKRDTKADCDLFTRLVEADPPHASPLEHVACPARHGDPQVGNLRGWRQYRHIILGR